jgi:VWFA-related protein
MRLTGCLRKIVVCELLVVLTGLLAQWSQGEDTPAVTMSVDVKVVTLPVTVRDKHGQIVRTLTEDDFLLEQDGRPQTIKYFSQEGNLPLTLGLLVDTSLSQRNVLEQERNASRSFLDQMLTQDKDNAFLIHFDREVELLQDLTPSREKLEKALDALETRPPDRGGSQQPPDGPQRMHRGGTLLYDAVFLASDELMKKHQGRKALIILSDGVDRGSKKSLESAMEAAQRTDTVVYSILFKDTQFERAGYQQRRRGGGGWPGGGYPGGGGGWPGGGRGGGAPHPSQQPRPDGKKILERISKETGGRLFEASKKESVAQIYTSIAEELRTQYSLGYSPTKAESTEGYHRIKLTAKGKDLSVQTRDGYYAER